MNVHAPVLVLPTSSLFILLLPDSLHLLQHSCISITAHCHHHPDHQPQNCVSGIHWQEPMPLLLACSFLIPLSHAYDDPLHLHLHPHHPQYSVSPQELLLLVLMVIWLLMILRRLAQCVWLVGCDFRVVMFLDSVVMWNMFWRRFLQKMLNRVAIKVVANRRWLKWWCIA